MEIVRPVCNGFHYFFGGLDCGFGCCNFFRRWANFIAGIRGGFPRFFDMGDFLGINGGTSGIIIPARLDCDVPRRARYNKAGSPTSVHDHLIRRPDMRNLTFAGSLLFVAFAAWNTPAVAEDRQEAIKQDQRKIEGTWRVVSLEFNGTRAKAEDERKITVVNGPDGTWSLRSEDQEVSRGTSILDPTMQPKTIDFTVTAGEGEGNLHLGIYELGEKTRKMCFASPGGSRPAEFSAPAGSDLIFIVFERVVNE